MATEVGRRTRESEQKAQAADEAILGSLQRYIQQAQQQLDGEAEARTAGDAQLRAALVAQESRLGDAAGQLRDITGARTGD